MSHKDEADDIFAEMLSGLPPAPPAAVPVVPVPRRQADEEPEPPAAETPEVPWEDAPAPEAPAVPGKPAVRPRRAPRPQPADPEPDADTEPRGGEKVAVSVDRDLMELMRLARPALGGVKTARLMLDAARRHWHHAADLPDLPATIAVQDRYGDSESTARYPVVMTPYMPKSARARLDADARGCGLDRSTFVGRVLRAYLTVDLVFVSVEHLQMHLLHSPAEIERIASELKAATRPARALPERGTRMWTAIPVPPEHPLREALDAARSSMPGCFSATQALLTVLPRLDGE